MTEFRQNNDYDGKLANGDQDSQMFIQKLYTVDPSPMPRSRRLSCGSSLCDESENNNNVNSSAHIGPGKK